MKNKVLIFAIIFFLTGVAVFSFFLITRDSEEEGADTEVYFDSDSLPVTGDRPNQTTETASVRSGRDFILDPDVDMWYEDEETYLIDENLSTDEIIFQTFYFPKDDSITISLQNENLRLARTLAEEALLERLGLPKEELCDLPILVTTPAFVSEEYSGINLGLSFCPNSVPL